MGTNIFELCEAEHKIQYQCYHFHCATMDEINVLCMMSEAEQNLDGRRLVVPDARVHCREELHVIRSPGCRLGLLAPGGLQQYHRLHNRTRKARHGPPKDSQLVDQLGKAAPLQDGHRAIQRILSGCIPV
jgi:hypothetical protein